MSTTIGAAIPLTQFAFQLASLESALLTGIINQEYTITSIQNMSSVNVIGHSPAPYVIVQKGTEAYGYDGSWVSSTPAFVCSDYTTDEYSFAFEDTDSARLLVQAPPDQPLADYSITLHHDGLEKTISGVVASGNPQEFVVTYTRSAIDVTPTGDTNASVSYSPNPLNLKGKGYWFNSTIELQNGINLNDIDASSIMLNDTVFADLSAPTQIGDNNRNGVPDLTVCFNRTSVADFILSTGIMFGNVTLCIAGRLTNGTSFMGMALLAVRMPGDINMDGKVDMADIGIGARAFGSVPGDSRWNPAADENEDGKISMFDIALVAQCFGKCYA